MNNQNDFASKLQALRELAAELMRECKEAHWKKSAPFVWVCVGPDGVPLEDDDGYVMAVTSEDHDTGGEGTWRLYVPAEQWDDTK